MWIWNERRDARIETVTIKQLVERLLEELGYKAAYAVRAYTLVLSEGSIRLCVDYDEPQD